MTDYRIGTNGKPITDVDNSEVPVPAVKPATTSATVTNVVSVDGTNRGFGYGIYAGSNGVSQVTFDFKTLVAGNGIQLDSDVNSITITATGQQSNLDIPLASYSTNPLQRLKGLCPRFELTR